MTLWTWTDFKLVFEKVAIKLFWISHGIIEKLNLTCQFLIFVVIDSPQSILGLFDRMLSHFVLGKSSKNVAAYNVVLGKQTYSQTAW